MKKTFIIIGVILAIAISFVIGLLVGQSNQAKPDLLIRKAEGTELLDDQKYGEYEKVADFKEGKYTEKPLVKFNGTLYIKSNKIIDYIAEKAQIGTIDQLIDSDYVPKVDGETNSKELLNAGVYPSAENKIVLNYNNDYVLYEKI